MVRPIKFKPEYIEKIIKFFDIEPYKQVVAESSTESFKGGGIKKKSVKYRLIPNKMPTLYRFSREIKVDYSTIWRWAEKGEDLDLEKAIESQMSAGRTEKEAIKIAQGIKKFCNAYKEAKELQKEFLINLGLAGAAPPAFAIFTAKNVTDMRDNSVVTYEIENEETKQKANKLVRNYLGDSRVN
ncbi:MAG: hypothetical protein AAB706_01495 [Patescibacteria group bacterium]